MKYTYTIDRQGLSKELYYVTITFDRTILRGDFYQGHSFNPSDANILLDNLAKTADTDGDFVNVRGSNVKVKMSPFAIAKGVKNVVKKIQRRYAKGESRRRVSAKELDVMIETLNSVSA